MYNELYATCPTLSHDVHICGKDRQCFLFPLSAVTLLPDTAVGLFPFIFRLFELSQRGPHLKGVCVELMSLPLRKSQVESEVNEMMNHALIDGLPEAKGPTADRYGYVRNVHAIMDVCIQDCPTSGNNKKSD